MSSQKVSIAAFAGSLRKKSFNRGLLRAVVALAPPDVEIRVIDIDDLPLFNADLEDETNPLPPVKRLCDAIKGADALLVVTPEYNYSMPAVTKNALDWASRTDGVLEDKPTALMGASPGRFGTVRCQLHVRQVAIENNMHVLNEPELYIAQARTKFDENGDLTDDETKKRVVELLEALAAFARRLKQGLEQSAGS
jgi:chromate reductase, NAD(P)H dehydrogenase (quinone)